VIMLFGFRKLEIWVWVVMVDCGLLWGLCVFVGGVLVMGGGVFRLGLEF